MIFLKNCIFNLILRYNLTEIKQVAKSERHSCQVAVKIVSKFQAPGDYLKKFLPREIEVVKGLKHVNLIRFLQAIETTHRLVIIWL